MATLDGTDFRNLKKRIQQDPAAKVQFKGWGLSRSVWKATFQAAENWFVDGFLSLPSTSFKAAIEAQTGPTTNARAIQVGKVWMGWRYAKFMGT